MVVGSLDEYFSLPLFNENSVASNDIECKLNHIVKHKLYSAYKEAVQHFENTLC